MHDLRTRLLALSLALAFCALAPAAAAAAWLGGIDFSHPTPSHLPHGERVFIDIDYDHADAGGVRIFVTPRSGGANTPGQGNSGSAIVPAGTGTVTRWFTVNSGTPVVDQVRIRMTNADQSVTYFDFSVRVGYYYGPSGIYNITLSHGDHSILANGEDLVVSFDYATTESPDTIIFARPWFSNAFVPGYGASGGDGGPPSGSGSQRFTFPTADANVNQIHFRMLTADQSTLLLEFNLAVTYWWRDVGVSNLVLSKPSPASLQLGEHLEVTFDYNNPTAEDMLVWTMPRYGAGGMPGGGTSGSFYMAPGTGTATRWFTGNVPADADAFRLLCRNGDQSVEHFDLPIPVSYHFDHHSVDNVATVPVRPAILDPGTQLIVTFDYHTDHPGDVLAWALPSFEGGWPPDFSVAGSPPLTTGSGSVSRWVRGLVPGRVIDHVQFRMSNLDQSEVLLEYHLPMTAFWDGAAATSPVPGAGPAAAVVLGQNYPNPFNPTTTIPLEVAATRHVKLSVYDLRGRRVATVLDGMVGAGRHDIPFDGTRLASGQYFYKLEGAGGPGRSMTLVK